ncbi:hypothetical protein [Bradyrhizobium neotropicale]|uniref:hypothetical protein n=1 Tax=Bradyrhizobium neotropicale TaxID=1497615 RepID=UPI001FF00FE0|nr:hypothetical protein [Bradyrhizobium neotropicale]
MQVGQATINDAGQSAEHHWLETLLSELTSARRDIELLQRLEQEHNRAEWLDQELAAAGREIEAQAARGAKASDDASRPTPASESSAAELQKILQQERERAERLEQDLAAARRDVETQTALAAKASEEASRLKQAGESSAAELHRSLQEERGRVERLEQDLAAARRDVETRTALAAKASEDASRLKQAGESSAAELQRSLQEERERSSRLEQDLAAARHDVEVQTALAAKATDEAQWRNQAAEAGAAELRQSMQRERERADALAHDLSMTRSATYAYEAQARKATDEAAELRQAAANGAPSLHKSAQDERERAERLVQDLAAARRDVEAQTALAAKATDELLRWNRMMEAGAAELRQSMQKGHERTNTLAQDRSMTWSSIYAYEAQARKAGDEAAELRQAAASTVPSLRKSTQSESDRPPQDFAGAYRVGPNIATIDSIARGKPAEENARPVVDRTPGRDGRGDAKPSSEEAVVAARLVARGSALLGHGDIGAARIVLERAIEMGSAQASFSLAETYDPLILAKWGAYGTRGDASKAQDLYAKADAAGIKEAKARFEALRP